MRGCKKKKKTLEIYLMRNFWREKKFLFQMESNFLDAIFSRKEIERLWKCEFGSHINPYRVHYFVLNLISKVWQNFFFTSSPLYLRSILRLRPDPNKGRDQNHRDQNQDPVQTLQANDGRFLKKLMNVWVILVYSTYIAFFYYVFEERG